MSADGTDVPPPYTPPTGPPQRSGGGGAMLAVGILTGFAVLFAVYLFLTLLAGPSWIAALGPVALVLVAAILLAIRPRSRMFGTGLLIGLGAWALLAGGICIPLLIPSAGVA